MHFIYGHRLYESLWQMQNATLHCFDPVSDMWQEKSSTCNPHFGSSLFVVNDRLCVAGVLLLLVWITRYVVSKQL